MKKLGFLAIAITTVITGCASNNAAVKPGDNIPDWVMNPFIENGLAGVDCVRWSGNMSTDQKMATANGRVALAQQIAVRVQAMDKTYASRSDSGEKTSVGNTFESVSKQLTNETLSGSRPTKYAQATINGVDHMCAQVSINPDQTKALFDKIMDASGTAVNAQDQDLLYQEFKAHQAQQDLEQELQRLQK